MRTAVYSSAHQKGLVCGHVAMVAAFRASVKPLRYWSSRDIENVVAHANQFAPYVKEVVVFDEEFQGVAESKYNIQISEVAIDGWNSTHTTCLAQVDEPFMAVLTANKHHVLIAKQQQHWFLLETKVRGTLYETHDLDHFEAFLKLNYTFDPPWSIRSLSPTINMQLEKISAQHWLCNSEPCQSPFDANGAVTETLPQFTTLGVRTPGTFDSSVPHVKLKTYMTQHTNAHMYTQDWVLIVREVRPGQKLHVLLQ